MNGDKINELMVPSRIGHPGGWRCVHGANMPKNVERVGDVQPMKILRSLVKESGPSETDPR